MAPESRLGAAAIFQLEGALVRMRKWHSSNSARIRQRGWDVIQSWKINLILLSHQIFAYELTPSTELSCVCVFFVPGSV